MTVTSRLRSLDRRVLREHRSGARHAWGRRHGWSLFLLLGLTLLTFGAWALSADRPALAVVPGAFGVGFIGIGIILFTQRTRT